MEIKNRYILLATGITIGVVMIIFAYQILDKDSIKNTTEKIHTEEPNNNKIIKLTEEEINEFGITVKTAQPGKIVMHTDLTGEIVPNPYNVAHIKPRYEGIVKNVYKKIGDDVKKGDKIATIESNESLVTYDVTSSIDGTILELHMTPGEMIGDDKHIVMIVDLNSVWAELNIYQKDIQNVKVGQKIQILTPNMINSFIGEIFYISPTVNEETRTAIARVKLGNRGGVWKPGMFVSAKLTTSIKNVPIAIENSSLQTFEDRSIIFVKNDEGFIPQVVKIGSINDELVEILSGLTKGQKYVSNGSFTLKSELLKGSFGGDDH